MTSPPLRLAVLASGRGSNLAAILDAIDAGQLQATVIGVFSDKRSANALQIARAHAIPATFVDPKAFVTREHFDAALFAAVDALRPDLVVLAGFMRVISQAAVESQLGRMINIHPSLLPRHKGLHTHRRALEAGDSEHGASVHLVTPDLDDGPVLAQARVSVQADDTEAALTERVLRVEHPLLIACLNEWQKGRFRYEAPQLLYRERMMECPLEFQAEPDAPTPLI